MVDCAWRAAFLTVKLTAGSRKTKLRRIALRMDDEEAADGDQIKSEKSRGIAIVSLIISAGSLVASGLTYLHETRGPNIEATLPGVIYSSKVPDTFVVPITFTNKGSDAGVVRNLVLEQNDASGRGAYRATDIVNGPGGLDHVKKPGGTDYDYAGPLTPFAVSPGASEIRYVAFRSAPAKRMPWHEGTVTFTVLIDGDGVQKSVVGTVHLPARPCHLFGIYGSDEHDEFYINAFHTFLDVKPHLPPACQ